MKIRITGRYSDDYHQATVDLTGRENLLARDKPVQRGNYYVAVRLQKVGGRSIQLGDELEVPLKCVSPPQALYGKVCFIEIGLK